MASYVYLLYTQISVVYSDWTNQGEYTLLVAFLIKEVFFATYICVWIVMRILIPIALLPLILLVKIATSANSNYQQQKVQRRFQRHLCERAVIHLFSVTNFVFKHDCPTLQRASRCSAGDDDEPVVVVPAHPVPEQNQAEGTQSRHQRLR